MMILVNSNFWGYYMGISKTVKYLDRSELEVQLELIAQSHLKDAVIVGRT